MFVPIGPTVWNIYMLMKMITTRKYVGIILPYICNTWCYEHGYYWCVLLVEDIIPTHRQDWHTVTSPSGHSVKMRGRETTGQRTEWQDQLNKCERFVKTNTIPYHRITGKFMVLRTWHRLKSFRKCLFKWIDTICFSTHLLEYFLNIWDI